MRRKSVAQSMRGVAAYSAPPSRRSQRRTLKRFGARSSTPTVNASCASDGSASLGAGAVAEGPRDPVRAVGADPLLRAPCRCARVFVSGALSRIGGCGAQGTGGFALARGFGTTSLRHEDFGASTP